MKKYLIFLLVFGMMWIVPVASAAPEVEALQSLDILADNNVNIFEYSFFDAPAEGKLKLYDLQNIWGSGAKMRIDINTDDGSDCLFIEVSGAYNGDNKSVHMLSVSLKNKGTNLLNTKITRETPLLVTIYDGKMTVEAGNSKRIVNHVSSFPGTMMTQSISGKLKVYLPMEKINTTGK